MANQSKLRGLLNAALAIFQNTAIQPWAQEVTDEIDSIIIDTRGFLVWEDGETWVDFYARFQVQNPNKGAIVLVAPSASDRHITALPAAEVSDLDNVLLVCATPQDMTQGVQRIIFDEGAQFRNGFAAENAICISDATATPLFAPTLGATVNVSINNGQLNNNENSFLPGQVGAHDLQVFFRRTQTVGGGAPAAAFFASTGNVTMVALEGSSIGADTFTACPNIATQTDASSGVSNLAYGTGSSVTPIYLDNSNVVTYAADPARWIATIPQFVQQALDRLANAVFALGSRQIGTATLNGASPSLIVVSPPGGVAAGSKVYVSRNTPGGTVGNLSVPVGSYIAGPTGSFQINSSANGDTSTVNWEIVTPSVLLP